MPNNEMEFMPVAAINDRERSFLEHVTYNAGYFEEAFPDEDEGDVYIDDV